MFLDIDALLACPGCRSNARTRANLVNRPGPFLVLAAVQDGAWLCVPLLSKVGANKLPLVQTLKSGPGLGWVSRPSFYSCHQFWIISTDCLIKASGGEFSPEGNRQRYAADQPAELAAIARHQHDSDAPYRPVAQLR